jgi:outer membrane immunogenic protein
MKSQFAKSFCLGAGALMLTASASAWAADLGPYQPYTPPPAPEASYEPPSIWEGAYVGINGGYGWSNSNFTEPEGGFGGGQIGYNWQRGHFVFGFEGDIQGADIGGTAFDQFGDVARSDVDWFSTVRGRLGFANGPFLVYGTGGLAVAGIDNRIHFTNGSVARDDSTQTGYAAGGGIEWAFAPNWSAKAEYLYMGFGDETLSSGDRINNDFQTVRVGLNYRFH